MKLFFLRKIHRICPRHHEPCPSAPAHGSTDFIKRWSLASGSTAQIESSEPVSLLGCLDPIWRWVAIGSSQRCKSHPASIRRLRRLAPVGGGAGSRSRRRIAAERDGSPEFEFSRATVIGFRWGLLLRDHSDEGNMFMLTLIGGEQQQSPTMVRWLGWCLSTVRAASGEASALRTCTKSSLSSLLASQPTNCSDPWWKTWIWWLPRVWRVLDLWPKNHTICGAIYKGF
jgi:hypothetical protein